MATANTNKTIFALGIVAVLGFLAYKLWPAIRRAINSGSGGGSGGVGPASAASSPYNPYSSQPSSGPSLGASLGSGSTSPGAASVSAARQFLQNFIGQGSYQNSTPSQQEYINTMADQLPANYPDSIPYEQTQNFDVNQLAYSPDDIGTDTADYNPYDYADTISPDAGGYIDDGSGDDLGGNVSDEGSGY